MTKLSATGRLFETTKYNARQKQKQKHKKGTLPAPIAITTNRYNRMTARPKKTPLFTNLALLFFAWIVCHHHDSFTDAISVICTSDRWFVDGLGQTCGAYTPSNTQRGCPSLLSQKANLTNADGESPWDACCMCGGGVITIPDMPSSSPSSAPSAYPSLSPSTSPSISPSTNPSNDPSVVASTAPSSSTSPSDMPTGLPSHSSLPSKSPATSPTDVPSFQLETRPNLSTQSPTIASPTVKPTSSPIFEVRIFHVQGYSTKMTVLSFSKPFHDIKFVTVSKIRRSALPDHHRPRSRRN